MADPTREAAFDLLTAVLDRRRPLEEALDALPATDLRDRAAGASPGRRGAAADGHAGCGAGAVPPQGAARPGAPCAASRRCRTAAAGYAAPCGGGDGGRPGARPRAGAVRRAGQRGAPPRGRRRRCGTLGPRRAASGYAGVAMDLVGRQRARDRPGPSARGAARPDPQAGSPVARRCAGYPPGHCAFPPAPVSPSCPVSTSAISGCRTPLPPCRPDCSRHCPANA